jgi:hypothetical protein
MSANFEKNTAKSKRRLFVLQFVQPGLSGLMDGSVSTLAPVFAAALATSNSGTVFSVGLAASVGAGISMGFAEALSDDGSLTGRGRPWVRGVICGLMTTVGGIGHTIPFLLSNLYDGVNRCSARGGVRARGHFMDSPPVYADPGLIRCFASWLRRHFGFCHRRGHWQLVIDTDLGDVPLVSAYLARYGKNLEPTTSRNLL